MSDLSNRPIVCFYNGVTFPTETETVEIEARPVPDSSGRAVMYVLYRLTLQATVATANQAAGATTDGTLASLRKLLTAYGGELHYENAGFGNLTVNVPAGGPTVGATGKARDAVWGPKPTLLRWKPLGQLAAEITWSVEVAVPECDTATYAFATLESVYRLQFDVDQSGYTRRTYSGHVRIPQTRAGVNVRTLQDQADRLRESINPPPVAGFRRTPGNFTLSEDKCRLDFSIVDQEIGPNYPPDGVVEVEASHSIQTDKAFGGLWFGTFRAAYEVSRGTPRSAAYNYFLSLLADRGGAPLLAPFRPVGLAPVPSVVVVRRFEATEPTIYGKSGTKGAAFSATYTFTAGLADLVKASGLWRPVPGSNWSRWSVSLANTAFHVRGNAKLRFDPSQEAIIDLCAQSTSRLKAGAVPADSTTLRGANLPQINKLPPPATSWLAYYSVLWLEVYDETIEMKLLPTAPVSPYATSPGLAGLGGGPGVTAGGGAGGGPVALAQVLGGTPGPFSPSPGSPGLGGYAPVPVVQTRAWPTVYAHLQGFAIRAGYPVNPPWLVQLANTPLVPANRGQAAFGHWVMASWFGLPIVGCWWHWRYLCAGPLTGLPLMNTPFLGY